MKSHGMFRAVSIAVVAGTAILLSGCGKDILGSETYETSNSYVENIAKPSAQIDITSFQFITNNQGWAVGYKKDERGRKRAMLWETKDSGTTWSARTLSALSPEYVHMETAKRGWMIVLSELGSSTRIKLLETLDGGRTWNWKQTLKPKSGLSLEQLVNSIANSTQMIFNSRGNGWLLIQGDLYRTVASGNAWGRVSQPGNMFGINEASGRVFAIGIAHIWEWLAGKWDVLYILPAEIQGEFYPHHHIPSYELVNRIEFSSSEVGYAMFAQYGSSMQGQEYLLLRSNDGGRSWNEIGGAFFNQKRWKVRKLPTGNMLPIDATSDKRVIVSMSSPFPYPMIGVISPTNEWLWICNGLHAPVGWSKGHLKAAQWIGANTGLVVIQTPTSGDVLLRTNSEWNHWVNITPQ